MNFNYSEPDSDSTSDTIKFWAKIGGAIILLLFLIFGATAGSKRVDAGEACALKQFGNLSGKDVGPGFNWNQPFGTDYVCMETRQLTQEYTDGDTKAQYKDEPITDAVSSDGVNNKLYAIFQFRIPRENIDDLYRNYGKTTNQVVDKMQITVREEVRAVVKEMVEDQVYLQTPMVSQAIADRLKPLIEANGITFVSFNITVVDPDDTYQAKVTERQIEAENAKNEAAKVETERQTAEKKKVAAQGDADAAVISAQGQADANEIIAASLKDNPELLTLEYYQTLGTVNWAILSPGEVQPTLPVTTPEATAP